LKGDQALDLSAAYFDSETESGRQSQDGMAVHAI
jgi:hypothetical protein